jgi:hypothetical protein
MPISFFIWSILISYSSVFNPIAEGGHRMAQRTVKVETIKDVSGEVNIAAGDIHRGFTAKQVSVLHAQITSTFPSKPFDWRRPYKGLDVFEEEDAGLFFGREKLIEDLPSGSACYSACTRRRWIVFQDDTLLWRP